MASVTPALRFPKFQNDWVETDLGGLATTVTSGSRDWAQYYSDEGSKFVRMTNLPRGGIQLLLDDLRYVELPEDSSEGKRTSLEAHDILISITAELGKIGLVPPGFGTAYINQHTALVRLDHSRSDARFVAHKLSSERMNNMINSLNDAGAKAGLNLPTIKSFAIHAPTLPEQRKIADFLTAVDGRIGQLSKKKALLEDYKKGVMQQLFTQALRFKDDHGNEFPAWEEKTLGEVADIKTGPFGSSLHQSDYVEVGTPIITVEHLSDYGLVHKDLPLVSDHDRERLKSYSLKENDIVFSRVGSVDRNSIVKAGEEGWLFSGRILRIRLDHRVFDARFLGYYFQLDLTRYRIRSVAVGQTMASLNTEILRAFQVVTASLPEQTKIANFLSALDRKIESVAQQISHTQAFKKGLLQQMFA